jgi:hypothetical protein
MDARLWGVNPNGGVETRRGSYRNVWAINNNSEAVVFDNDKTL